MSERGIAALIIIGMLLITVCLSRFFADPPPEQVMPQHIATTPVALPVPEPPPVKGPMFLPSGTPVLTHFDCYEWRLLAKSGCGDPLTFPSPPHRSES